MIPCLSLSVGESDLMNILFAALSIMSPYSDDLLSEMIFHPKLSSAILQVILARSLQRNVRSGKFESLIFSSLNPSMIIFPPMQ